MVVNTKQFAQARLDQGLHCQEIFKKGKNVCWGFPGLCGSHRAAASELWKRQGWMGTAVVPAIRLYTRKHVLVDLLTAKPGG